MHFNDRGCALGEMQLSKLGSPKCNVAFPSLALLVCAGLYPLHIVLLRVRCIPHSSDFLLAARQAESASSRGSMGKRGERFQCHDSSMFIITVNNSKWGGGRFEASTKITGQFPFNDSL